MWEDSPDMNEYDEDTDNQSYPAAVSDIGCEREINEDRYACFSFDDATVWVVCDGMGGAVGGELAAQLAIDTIKKVLESDPESISHALLAYAFNEANRVVVLRRQNPAFSGMGTTIVGSVITKNYISILHAGDSRAYILRNGEIIQLTVDHTYVQDLVSRGEITQAEALQHPQSHVLTRCIGGQLRLDYDEQQFPLLPSEDAGDTLMLCSDGLYSLVSDEEIKELVEAYSPQVACSRFVELARARGGYDNITIAVIPLGMMVDLEKNTEINEDTSLSKSKSAQSIRSKNKQSAMFKKPELAEKSNMSTQKKVLLFGLIGFLSICMILVGLLLLV